MKNRTGPRRGLAPKWIGTGIVGALVLAAPYVFAAPDGPDAGSAPAAADVAPAPDAALAAEIEAPLDGGPVADGGPAPDGEAAPDGAAPAGKDDDWGDLEVKEADPKVVLPKLMEGMSKLSGQPYLSAADAAKYLASVPEHVRVLLDKKIKENRITNSEQLAAILALKLAPDKLEIILKDNCILCHVDPESQMERSQFLLAPAEKKRPLLLNLTELVSDVHFRTGLSCSGCHGGTPDVKEHTDEMRTRWPGRDSRHTDRSWIPEFCGHCHSDSNFMRNYNPALPTDQLAKYRDSMHGEKLLKEGDSKAAQCVSCHGVHGIRKAESNLSKVNAKHVPETCGACHADAEYMKGYKARDGSPLPTDQLERYKKSVHGKALLEKGDMGAPACNDCHGNHAAQPPEVASVSQVCRTCHVTQATLFDGSKHKKAFTANGWPECEKCHTKHDIQKASDSMLGTAEEGLCVDCHKQYSKDNPDCLKTAGHFRDTITSLKKDLDEGKDVVEALAKRGQDTDDLVAARGELEEGLTKARTSIHSFDKSTFDSDGDKAISAVQKTRTILTAADEEFSFRQKGVAVFIGIMVVLALGIYLRLRSIEAKQRAAAAEQPKT